MSSLSFHDIADQNAENNNNDEERLRMQMQQLAAAQDELLGRTPSNLPPASPQDVELERLRAENAALRKQIQTRESRPNGGGSGRAEWAEQQKEYEALLEEKSDVIRELHQKLRDMKKKFKGAPQPAADANEPIPERQELVAMKRELDEQRRQFEEDEQSMMQQMQQMEMSMSRERAEMARQRNELQRMKETLDREIDRALRDPNLQDRLMSLQRSQHEGNQGDDAPKKHNSSLIRRIFG